MLGHWHVVLAAVSLAVAMVLSAWAGTRHVIPALTLVPLAAAWFGLDQTFEGKTLVDFDARHGLTLSDLVGVIALIAAVVELARHALRRVR